MSESGEIIAEPTSFFKELEDAVLEVSPDFNKNLDLLTDKRLTIAEHNMALLIKCGISPTQIGKLICREKGTISSHRTKISRKIYDKNVGNTTIDGIICLL